MTVTIDVGASINELEQAQEAHVRALGRQLTAELARKTEFETQKTIVITTAPGEKAPSEAACERQARVAPAYLKACKDEIEAVKACLTASYAVDTAKFRVQALIGVGK